MDKPEVDDEIITCWCGVSGTYEELFDDSGLDESCCGQGMVNCTCGGDFCVCHHHGETECPGCEDCDCGEPEDDYDDEPDRSEPGEEMDYP